MGKDQMAENDPEADRIQREALAWLQRLTSGAVSEADIAALDRWRAASPRHRRALAEANLLWDVLGKVAQQAGARRPAQEPRPAFVGRPLARRVLLAGAAAAGIACLAVRPPAHLWPAVSEFLAAYRTATGERRQLAIAAGITVEMDTQTSLTAPAADGQRYSLELVSGQITVEAAARPVVIAAAGGQTRSDRATLNIRRDGASVCVTCTAGAAEVSMRSATAALAAGQQVTYGDGRLGPVSAVNPTVVTAWQRGELIFRDVPFAQVVAEVNRYRPGRIILVNEALAERKVVAGVRLDRIDDVVDYFAKAFGARARRLPGGVVLLS